MPAKSLQQKRLMCMALAYKNKELKFTKKSKISDSLKIKVKKMAKSMSKKQLQDFCKE